MARISNKKKTVGFIGLGNMGQPMAMRLSDAGYKLTVYDLRREAEKPLIDKGAIAAKTPKQSVGDVTITVLATPPQVEDVYFGKNGLLEGLTGPGKIIIEATGIDPELTLRIEKAVKERGSKFVSCALIASGAPSVTIPGGLLQIIAGGERSSIETCLDLLKTLGQTVVCAPNVITPKLLKIAIIMLNVASNIASLEAAYILKRNDIDPAWLIRLMDETGLSHEARELKILLSGGLKLGGNVRNSHKDVLLALQTASEKDVPVPLMACAHQILQACKGAGFAGKGTPESLLALYERILKDALPISWKVDLKELLPPLHRPKVIWLE